jgi:hypothetical protein
MQDSKEEANARALTLARNYRALLLILEHGTSHARVSMRLERAYLEPSTTLGDAAIGAAAIAPVFMSTAALLDCHHSPVNLHGHLAVAPPVANRPVARLAVAQPQPIAPPPPQMASPSPRHRQSRRRAADEGGAQLQRITPSSPRRCESPCRRQSRRNAAGEGAAVEF